MAGRGNIGDVEPILNNRCSMLRNGKWQPMTEPICCDRAVDNRFGGTHSGVGSGASFADAYAKAHPEFLVGLIPCADGGTKISEWQPGEVLFDNAVMQTRLAMRSMLGKLAGILWHQGESDSKDEENAKLYRERLERMISAFRRELHADDVPFIMGEAGIFINHAGEYPFVGEINEIQRTAAEERPYCGFVSVEGLTHKPDFLHFDAVSQRELGLRYFAEFERACAKPVPILPKKVFLIGDSIRFGVSGRDGAECGYGVHLKEILESNGIAKVYAPNENCRFLQYTLRYLHEWAAECGEDVKNDIDAVHWNNGLWDVLRLFGDEPFTPVEMYREYLLRVHSRIRKLFPKAKIIFALNTPVTEEMSSPDFTRKNSDIEAYNRTAAEVLSPLGVTINDLYTTAAEIRPTLYLDWVHYNAEGSKALAEKTADVIKEVLSR